MRTAPQALAVQNNGAAQAQGANRAGAPAGAFGTFAAFSFQNFKLMTAGEGGILLTNDRSLAETARLIGNCGRPDGDRGYRHDVLGTNARMTEFQGAILNVELDRLEGRAVLRASRAKTLRRGLAHINGIRLQSEGPVNMRHAYYMVVFECDRGAFGGLPRDAIVAALNAEGVQAFRMYPVIQDTGHFAKEYRRLGGDPAAIERCPISHRLADNGIWLHHRVLLGSNEVVEQTAAAVAKVAEYGPELCDKLSPSPDTKSR